GTSRAVAVASVTAVRAGRVRVGGGASAVRRRSKTVTPIASAATIALHRQSCAGQRAVGASRVRRASVVTWRPAAPGALGMSGPHPRHARSLIYDDAHARSAPLRVRALTVSLGSAAVCHVTQISLRAV